MCRRPVEEICSVYKPRGRKRGVTFRTEREAVKMFSRGFPLFSARSSARIIVGNGVVCAEIWRRFGGGSDRNRALLGNPVQPVHDMQIVQSRINAGYFASRLFGEWGRSSVG